MRQHRKGTVILLCIVIITSLGLMLASYLRVVHLQRDASNQEHMLLLCREAARSGLRHAMELIMRDHVEEPFTRIDNAATTAFMEYMNPRDSVPYNVDNRYSGGMSDFDRSDINNEHQLDWGLVAGMGQMGERYEYSGATIHAMRARYIEPEFYNLPVPDADPGDDAQGRFDLTVERPDKAVLFEETAHRPDAAYLHDPANPADPSAMPERHAGTFLTNELLPVVGNDLDARRSARYRLRYAVALFDLDGHMVTNGDPAVDFRDVSYTDPSADPSPSVSDNPTTPLDASKPTWSLADYARARVVRGQHALGAVVPPMGQYRYGNSQEVGVGYVPGPTGAARMEHIWLGRGAVNNYDRLAANGYAPSTFPLMYRRVDSSYEHFSYNRSDFGPLEDRLFEPPGSFTNQDLVNGGKILPGRNLPSGGYCRHSLHHVLLGPQMSFFNQHKAIDGMKHYDGPRDMGLVASFNRFSPFGRGLGYNPSETDRYSGPVDTPWCINVMTAAPQTIRGMIEGYMPPGAMIVRHEHLDAAKRSIPPFTYRAVNLERDLFVREMTPAFAEYESPDRVVDQDSSSSPVSLEVDYHQQSIFPSDPGFRGPTQRYPGPLAYNGYVLDGSGATDPNGDQVSWQNDTLGYYLRRVLDPNQDPTEVAANGYRPVMTDTDFWRPISDFMGDDLIWRNTYRDSKADHQRYAAASMRPTGTERDRFMCHPDSIWDVLAHAMTGAIAIARAQSAQLETMHSGDHPFIPTQHKNGGAWTAAERVVSLRQLDALFVAQLGSDFNNPTSPTVQQMWMDKNDLWKRWVIPLNDPAAGTSYNLAALAAMTITNPIDPSVEFELMAINDPNEPGYDAAQDTITAQERTQLIELIINDMRLSFFGSSPAYGWEPDGSYRPFRALDLNGDGFAACSGFDPGVTVPTAREVTLGIGKYAPAVAGVATRAVEHPFSLTGNFFIGKSRFWRIVVRGELWDNLIKETVCSATLESIYSVDPMQHTGEWDSRATPRRRLSPDPAAGFYANHVIHQRWHFDLYRGLRSRRF